MQNNILVGVDIGGTTISAGCLLNNMWVKKCEMKTGAERPLTEILATLFEVIDQVLVEGAQAIGVGVPGYIDHASGEIKLINNIPAFKGLNLKIEIEKKYNIPVYLNNDANCFALGAYFFGTPSSSKNLVGITLGTGLGGGIVINGKLHSGIFGGAGEFGCLPYLDGTFEDYCSSKFFDSKYHTNGKELFIKAKNGDSEAQQIFEEFGQHLGHLMLHILYTLAPEKVVVGGSIAEGSEYFMSGMRMVIGKFPVEIIRKNFKVEISNIKYPGIHGAVALCLHEVELV